MGKVQTVLLCPQGLVEVSEQGTHWESTLLPPGLLVLPDLTRQHLQSHHDLTLISFRSAVNLCKAIRLGMLGLFFEGERRGYQLPSSLRSPPIDPPTTVPPCLASYVSSLVCQRLERPPCQFGKLISTLSICRRNHKPIWLPMANSHIIFCKMFALLQATALE